MTTTEVRTERLLLRRFADADREAFAEMNADPVVMATIGTPMTRQQSDAFLDRIGAGWEERGFGLWCVDLDGECLGFTGLSAP
ncbi:MAG: GNAT family N-acetyltransferase, partial [Ilumatobacteraceae bacterium]